MAVQPGLRQTWSKPERWFSHVAAHMQSATTQFKVHAYILTNASFYVLLLFRYLYLLRKVTLRVTLFKVNFFFVLEVTETETTYEIPSPRLLWGSLDNDPVTNMKAIWDSLNVGQFLLDNKKYHLSLLRENSTTPSKHCTIVIVTVNGAFLGVFYLPQYRSPSTCTQ